MDERYFAVELAAQSSDDLIESDDGEVVSINVPVIEGPFDTLDEGSDFIDRYGEVVGCELVAVPPEATE